MAAGNENVDILFNPCLSRQYFIAEFLGFSFVDPAEVVGNRQAVD